MLSFLRDRTRGDSLRFRLARGKQAAAILPVLLLGVIGCVQPGPPSVSISLGGAQIPVELVESWLREAQSPGFATTQVSPVYLSQHGFENLARGECDLACTDRPLALRELEQFGDHEVQGRRVAFYGYALYVNPSNPLDAIFAKHVRLIFQRRIKDWSELAGDRIPELQGPISLYGPGKSTRGGAILSPIANIWFGDPTWQVLDSDAAIVAKVAEDPLALGFASIGYDEAARYLGLRLERQSPPVFPSLEAIEAEQYGLAKLIYLYYLDPPGPRVQAVLDYLFSNAGRRAIESTDMWSIPADRAPVPAPQ
jgi:ABC-type phosphate transport system substrate-binding protein